MNLSNRIEKIYSWFRSSCKLEGNCELEGDVNIKGKPRIVVKSTSRIIIGTNVFLNSNPIGYHAGMAFPVTLISDGENSVIKVGSASRLHGCCIHAKKLVELGKYCLVASGAQIIDSHGHESAIQYSYHRHLLQDIPDPIYIGDYCWIGLNAIILKGVQLGKGSIVAANSVVLSGIYPAFSLVAGVPARVIKTLKEEDVLPENINLADMPEISKQLFIYR